MITLRWLLTRYGYSWTPESSTGDEQRQRAEEKTTMDKGKLFLRKRQPPEVYKRNDWVLGLLASIIDHGRLRSRRVFAPTTSPLVVVSVGFRFIHLVKLVPRCSLRTCAFGACTSTVHMEAPRLPHIPSHGDGVCAHISTFLSPG